MAEPVARRIVLIGLMAVAISGCTSARPSPSASLPSTSPAVSPAPTITALPATPVGTPTPTEAPTGIPTDTLPPASATPDVTAEPSPTETPSSGSPVPGEFNPEAITLSVEAFASGFRSLTFATNAGDGSGLLYAVEQVGAIWTIDAAGSVAEQPFLDVSDRVRSGGEQGLLGLAFHPDFASNGRFFVDYTTKGGDTVISEFARSADGTVDPAAERILLTIGQPFSNHNGGMLAFGSDGYLYIAMGDGGSGGDPFGNGQKLSTLLGKILRIDVDSGDPYGIPADNPFADGANGARPEIWDYGMRNPWRFSFDRVTGGLFIGDVGQDLREEVDVEPAGDGGRNYGWNVMEGLQCYGRSTCNKGGLTMPVLDYGRGGGECAVTGGYVYRGTQFPALYGGYVFSDFCTGELFAIDAQHALDSGSANMISLGDTNLNPSAFGEDEAGELYVVDHGGSIYRLVATPR